MTDSQPPTSENPAETYEAYSVPPLFRPWAAELVDLARPQAGERVLDLACGTGVVARAIAHHLSGQVELVGVDLSPAMVAVGRAAAAMEGITITWHVARADAIPLPDAALDLVVIHQGLQFFPDRLAALQEVLRVLVPGGRVVSATWTALGDNPFNAALAAIIARHLGTPAMDAPFALGERAALQPLFEQAGFGDIDIRRIHKPVRFPDPATFVARSVESASASVPGLQALDGAARTALIAAIQSDMVPVVRAYTEGEQVVTPRGAHLVRAYKPA